MPHGINRFCMPFQNGKINSLFLLFLFYYLTHGNPIRPSSQPWPICFHQSRAPSNKQFISRGSPPFPTIPFHGSATINSLTLLTIIPFFPTLTAVYYCGTSQIKFNYHRIIGVPSAYKQTLIPISHYLITSFRARLQLRIGAFRARGHLLSLGPRIAPCPGDAVRESISADRYRRGKYYLSYCS